MNFSGRQWLLSIGLDLFIKIVVVTYLGALVTLGAASIAGFVCLAVMLSVFHLVCLFLGCTFVVAFELVHLQLSRSLKFVLALIVANILFVASFTAFFVLSSSSDDVPPSFPGDLFIALFLAATNLMPVLIVAACGCVFGRAKLSAPS